MERKTMRVPLEIKSLADREFDGYGSVFRNIDHGRDIVLPGAYKTTLAEHRDEGALPPMHWAHDVDQLPPGKWLDMAEDDDGLAVKGYLADTTLGNDVRELVKIKAVRGLSIGYSVRDWDYDNDGNRLLKELKLWEVSIVSLAMNPLARITAAKARLSAAGEYVPTSREMETILRDEVGLTNKQSKKVLSLFGKTGARDVSSDHRDGDDAGDDDLAQIGKSMEALSKALWSGAYQQILR